MSGRRKEPPLPPGEGRGEGPDNGRQSPKAFRRGLRQSATPAEKKLWTLLRNRRLDSLKFRRQHSVGPYVVDLTCHAARLAVEVDGSVHDDPARAAYDGERQRALEGAGLRVVRVSNAEVLRQPETALARIAEAARPHPDPLPGGEGGA